MTRKASFNEALDDVVKMEKLNVVAKCNEPALRMKVVRLQKAQKLLKRNNKSAEEKLLSKEFEIPVKKS